MTKQIYNGKFIKNYLKNIKKNRKIYLDSIDIKDRKLKNGIRLITIYKPGELMNFALGFKGGSMEDPEDKKGLTHFLEHMLFTGTKKRSHDRINEDLEYLGGTLDAFTDNETLTLTITVLKEELESVMEIVSDMVMNSDFPPEETEREKKVILSEYREGLEDMELISYDRLYEYAFPKDPLRYSVIGNEETILSLTREDLLKRKEETITPGNAVMVVTGPFSHGMAEETAEQYFGPWVSSEEKERVKSGRTPGKTDKKSFVKNRRGTFETCSESSDMGTVSFLYTFPELPEEYETPLKIINNRLGDSDNSLLFREIRLLRGLSYDVYSSLEIGENLKCLEIYCAADTGDLEKIVNLIRKTVSGLKSGKYVIGKRNLEIMKKILKTNISALPEDTQALGNYVLSNAQEGKPLLKYVCDLKKTGEVTEEEIKEVIDYVFKNPTIHILRGGKKDQENDEN